MAYIVRMPKLGLEMEQGTVIEWAVEPGEDVTEGDLLAEVESEKSIGEVEAREDGQLRRVYVEEDESVPPGTPIAIAAAPDADIADLEAEAEADLAADAPEMAPGAASEAEADTGAAESATAEASATDQSDGGTATATGGGAGGTTGDVKASPRAEKRAEELGVDLTAVEGTGFDGAVTEEDVEAAAETTDESAPADTVKASPRAKKRAEELGVDLTAVEGSGFDGAVTEEDVEAAAETAEEEGADTAETDAAPAGARPDLTGSEGVERIAPVDELATRYHRVTAVADPAAGETLFETMEAVRSAFEERVTMTDVLMIVASATLTDRPVLNGTYTEATHQVHERQDIALVADVNGGPVAGVVSDVANRSLTEVVTARESVQSGPGGADGATFTVANAAETTGEGRLVNPPAVAALEVDPTGQRAMPAGDGVDLQPLVTAGLTYDTRAVGEGEARAFLDRFFERAASASELVLGSYRGRE